MCMWQGISLRIYGLVGGSGGRFCHLGCIIGPFKVCVFYKLRPECTPFAPLGRRLGPEDPRCGTLVACIQFIKKKMPTCFVLENTPAIESFQDFFALVRRALEGLGNRAYDITIGVLDAHEHGSPQVRKRLWIVGIKKKHKVENFKFPIALTGSPRLEDIYDKGPLVEATLAMHPENVNALPFKHWEESMRKIIGEHINPLKTLRA